MSNLTYFNSSFDTSNNHYNISSNFGYMNLNLGIPDCFVWNNLVQVNNSNIYVDLSFGDSNSRYNTRINRSNIELRYNNSNILTSNYVMPLNTSNEITLKYSIDTLGLFVNRSNLINITYSNTDFDDGYYQLASSNHLGLSNQVGGITNFKFPRVNGIFTFRTPVEFQGNVKINGNVISSNIIQLSNLVFTQCNTSSNLFNLSNNLVNTSNALTNRINWNSNELNNRVRKTGDNLTGEYTFCNTHPLGLTSSTTYTASVNQNLSAEYIGEAFIKTITSNVERNVLSVIHNSNQVIRIVNDGRIIASNISSCNLNTLSNQIAFSSNTAIWSSNNIGSINFGSNNSVFSSNTAVWSSNNLLNRNSNAVLNGNLDINGLVSVSNLRINRGTRIVFNNINDSNHLLYMNNPDIDGEGLFSGIKWNVNNGLWIRTGIANLGSNTSNQVIPPQTAVFITSNRVGISKSNPTRELDVNGNIICSNILCSNINTSNIVCSNITGNNIYFNEIFEGGITLSNKYLTLSSSNSSNFTLGTTAPINNIYITEENGGGGGGFGSLLLAGLVSAGVSAIVGFGMNGIKVAAGGVERSLAEWGEWGVNKLQNGLSRVVNDMQNRFLKGYTKMISDGGREWLNITGGPPTGLSAGIGPYTEKIALLGDSFKAGLFSVSIDGDSNTITITNFNSNTSNITSNVVISDNNSYFMSNVAIGKSNPTSMLDVNGTITASGLSVPIITTLSNNITTLSNQVYSFSNISSNVFNLSNQLNEFNWSNTKLINSNTPFVLSGSAIQESNWVRLTDFLPNQTGTILYSNISQSNDLRVSFDMFGAKPSNITNGADGIYLNLFSSNTAFQGTGYCVFFDNFNGGMGQNDALRILWNNSTIFNSNLGLSNYWDSSNWVNVNISLSNQSFNINVNSNQRVFNFTDTTPRNKGDINNFYINGRTGGFCNIHRIKDVQFDTVKDWKWYNDINNNLIINNSNILNNRLNTASNSLVAVSNYLYNIIDTEATFASNIGVYSSNTIINTSNLLSNRITGLSNIIINNSNAIHPQATFSSNLAVYSSNAINSLNSNSPVFSSNVAVWSSNNMIRIFASNQTIFPNTGNAFDTNFITIRNSGPNDGSANSLILGVGGSAFNGIATINSTRASGDNGVLSFQIQSIEAMRINTNRTITLNSNLTACNVSALNITGISNIAVWSSNNINAVDFGSNNSVFSSNTATWTSNNLIRKTGDIISGEYTVSNTHPLGLTSSTTYTANLNQNMSAEYVGEAFIKCITSNVDRNILSVINNSNQVVRIRNNGDVNILGTLGIGCGNLNTNNSNQILLGNRNNIYRHAIRTRHFNTSNTSTDYNAIDFNVWRVGQNINDVGDANVMTLTSTSIGIGTTTPVNNQGSLLHIRTSNALANSLHLQNAGTGRCGISFQTASSTWFMNNDNNGSFALYGGVGDIGLLTNSNIYFMDQSSGNAIRTTFRANGNIGIGTTTPNGQLQFNNILNNRKIVLWEGANNDEQYYGLGISSSAMRYNVDGTGAFHRFYAGVSSFSNSELFRIQGNKRVGVNPGYTLETNFDVNGTTHLGGNTSVGFLFPISGYVLGVNGTAATNTNLFRVSGNNGDLNDHTLFSIQAEGFMTPAPTNVASCVKIGRHEGTTRSIIANGSINGSFFDLAEYFDKKNNFILNKGDVCGIDVNGKLTNKHSESIHFVVKSTQPSFVLGDVMNNDADNQLREMIGMCGRVPVNYTGSFNVGDFIIPIRKSNDTIGFKVEERDKLNFNEYLDSIGVIVERLTDGRPYVLLKIV